MAVQAGKPVRRKTSASLIPASEWGFTWDTNVVAWFGSVRECWPQMLPTDKATWRKRRLTLLPDVVAWPSKADNLMCSSISRGNDVYNSMHDKCAYTYTWYVSLVRDLSVVQSMNHFNPNIRPLRDRHHGQMIESMNALS